MSEERKTSGKMSGELEQFNSELAELVKIREELEPKMKRFLEMVDSLHSLQSQCTGLRDKLKKGNSSAKQLLKNVELTDESKLKEHKLAQKLLDSVNRKLPGKSSWLINLVVGDLNVWNPRFTFRMDYKKKYESYKLQFSVVIIAFSALILGLIYNDYESRLLESVFHFMMMLFYSTVTIREHILRVNGSQIRSWWTAHQYLSMAQSVVHFSWPESSSYEQFRSQFFVFSLYIGVVQLIQHWYQTKILYTKIALGHGKEEMATSRSLPDKSTFLILLVALAMAYIFQFANGVKLSQMYLENPSEWQVPFLAINFLILGFGNTMTTMQVVFNKLKNFKAKYVGNAGSYDSPFMARKTK